MAVLVGFAGGAAGVAMTLMPRVRQMERTVRSCILTLDVLLRSLEGCRIRMLLQDLSACVSRLLC